MCRSWSRLVRSYLITSHGCTWLLVLCQDDSLIIYKSGSYHYHIKFRLKEDLYLYLSQARKTDRKLNRVALLISVADVKMTDLETGNVCFDISIYR